MGTKYVAYYRGASGHSEPVIANTRIRVQTIVWSSREMTVPEIAQDFDLTEEQVREALAFYEDHKAEIELSVSEEKALEPS